MVSSLPVGAWFWCIDSNHHDKKRDGWKGANVKGTVNGAWRTWNLFLFCFFLSVIFKRKCSFWSVELSGKSCTRALPVNYTIYPPQHCKENYKAIITFGTLRTINGTPSLSSNLSKKLQSCAKDIASPVMLHSRYSGKQKCPSCFLRLLRSFSTL